MANLRQRSPKQNPEEQHFRLRLLVLDFEWLRTPEGSSWSLDLNLTPVLMALLTLFL